MQSLHSDSLKKLLKKWIIDERKKYLFQTTNEEKDLEGE
jgi:hypothetical protein